MRSILCILGLTAILSVVASAQNYCACPPPYGGTSDQGLMSYWQFNEGSGSTAYDTSGYDNFSTYLSASWTIDSRNGYALSFDGNDYVKISTWNFGIDVSNAFSISLWFKFPSGFSGQLIKRGEYAYPFQIYNYGGRLGTIIRLNLNTYYLSSNEVLHANTWYHCVITYKSGERKIYLNGKLDAADSPVGNLSTLSNYDTIIGDGFNGVIDEVRVYNRALTQTEVTAIYTNAKIRIVQVAAGYHFSVALKNDGTVATWGGAHSGNINVPPNLNEVKAIAASSGVHILALKGDGTIVAWGNNGFGQCNIPAGLKGVKAITAGGSYSMALKSNGTVIAWGNNQNHQCDVPTGLAEVIAIAAGDKHAVALKSNGTVATWGDNSSGQCNIPSGLSGVKAIAAGAEHTVALKYDGTVAAWGENFYLQCNPPSGLNGVIAVSAGPTYTTALKHDGKVVAWGDNSDLQCNVPGSLSDVIAISSGGFHTLALKNDGRIAAWGYGYAGQCDIPVEYN